jgi:transposase
VRFSPVPNGELEALRLGYLYDADAEPEHLPIWATPLIGLAAAVAAWGTQFRLAPRTVCWGWVHDRRVVFFGFRRLPSHRRQLRRRGIAPEIARRKTAHGSGLGRYRWVVERTFAWLHQFKRLLVRYDRRHEIHEAFLALGCCIVCYRRLRSTSL